MTRSILNRRDRLDRMGLTGERRDGARGLLDECTADHGVRLRLDEGPDVELSPYNVTGMNHSP